MSLHCFFVPARVPEPAQTELNNFMATRRVLAVHRQWVDDGGQSGWAFCVELIPGPGPLPAVLKDEKSAGRRAPDVDYKQVLSESDFAIYARLREWRLVDQSARQGARAAARSVSGCSLSFDELEA